MSCPGPGRCHIASWCPDCDVGSHGPCDIRARGEQCDRHPSVAVVRDKIATAKHELLCLDEDLCVALIELRNAEEIAVRLRTKADGIRRDHTRAAEDVEELESVLAAAQRDEGAEHAP